MQRLASLGSLFIEPLVIQKPDQTDSLWFATNDAYDRNASDGWYTNLMGKPVRRKQPYRSTQPGQSQLEQTPPWRFWAAVGSIDVRVRPRIVDEFTKCCCSPSTADGASLKQGVFHDFRFAGLLRTRVAWWTWRATSHQTLMRLVLLPPR
jgi:hypothetical protein